ncbi:MAG: hypothetical protein A2169_15895 [Deltaproteobacteria bacterium RBG_13_47_9]|nr:MAG: hypothetical protein A2169_15895 [Deltaproteobacteria bacterium RBG_13_47_9]
MVDNRFDKYLILSDLHFGVEETSLNRSLIIESLANYIAAKGPWKSVIFSGDALDLNLSTFTISIEGKAEGGRMVIGFREFLKRLYNSPITVGTWVYIPGNHDYVIWNLLSVKKACVDILAKGEAMRSMNQPLKECVWEKGSAFISGVFPMEIRDKVTVEYPDHAIKYSGGKIVITHGHYLDPKQTLFKQLDKLIKEMGNVNRAVRKMFIETAQYQAIANSISYTPEMRKFVSYLFGPSSIAKTFRQIAGKNIGNLSRIFPFSPLRDESINTGQLRAIEFYLRYFRDYRSPPDYFIFGHTHEQSRASTSQIQRDKRLFPDKDIQVYNAGTFLPKRNKAATFVVVEIPTRGTPNVIPVCISKHGKTIESEFH